MAHTLLPGASHADVLRPRCRLAGAAESVCLKDPSHPCVVGCRRRLDTRRRPSREEVRDHQSERLSTEPFPARYLFIQLDSYLERIRRARIEATDVDFTDEDSVGLDREVHDVDVDPAGLMKDRPQATFLIAKRSASRAMANPMNRPHRVELLRPERPQPDTLPHQLDHRTIPDRARGSVF
jgi:hypothetical protein